MTAPNVTVNKDTTLAELESIADGLETMLKASNLAAPREKIVEDLKKKVASFNGLDVATWEAGQVTSAPVMEPDEPEEEVDPVEAAASEEERREKGLARVTKAIETDGDYFWMSDENKAVGRTWADLRKAGIPMNLLVTGPSGCGKTEGLKRLAEAMGVPFYKVDCASITTDDKWVGHKEVITTEAGPQTDYVLSEHLRWLSADGCAPGILVYDEITRLHPSRLNILIPILDGSQGIWVPDLGVYIKVHPDTLISATANIGVGFTGTFSFDHALHDRFGVTMEQGFPPDKEEQQILIKKTGIAAADARKLVAVANQTRNKVITGELAKPVSTRALIDCAYWVVAGMPLMDAAEATFIKKYSSEGASASERFTVQTIVQGIAGGKK